MLHYESATVESKERGSLRSFRVEPYLKDRKVLIDRTLERYFDEYSRLPRTLSKAMHYALFSGGKRIRPILTLAAGELFGAKQKSLLPFACAIELIHNYSIVHDDLPALDNDDYRRGEPTSHKVFGEGIALLAGDALLTEAFHMMSAPPVVRSLEPKLVLELIQEISHAAGISGLVGGQVFDLEAEGREADRPTVESIHAFKTGALIVVAARTGARIGEATAAELRRISRYAKALGLAFQIADDILDAENLDSSAGQGGNREKSKATYPSVAGLAAAKDRLSELGQISSKELEPFGAGAEPLRGIARYVAERAL